MLEPGYLTPLGGTFAAQFEPCQMLRSNVDGEVRITHRCQ
jgi:hypothetical protein